jgi:lambda repressor-like predicted transcriptional regulator
MTVSIELQFDAPKGQRMHRYGMGVTVMDRVVWASRYMGNDVTATVEKVSEREHKP